MWPGPPITIQVLQLYALAMHRQDIGKTPLVREASDFDVFYRDCCVSAALVSPADPFHHEDVGAAFLSQFRSGRWPSVHELAAHALEQAIHPQLRDVGLREDVRWIPFSRDIIQVQVIIPDSLLEP